MSTFHNHDFSLRQVQYAVAVASEGGFGLAAVACGVSQPSLSAQVAKLERAFGAQLFERLGRGIRLTAEGRALLPVMQSLLDAAGVVAESARALGEPYAVTLRIGVIPTLAPYVIPGVVGRLQQRSPRPKVHWLELTTAACEEAVANGELDGALIADPPTRPGFSEAQVGWDPFWLVGAESRGLKGPAQVGELPADALLLLEDGHCLRDHTMSLCMKPGDKGAPFVATSLSTLVQMVASDMGLSVVPSTALPVETSRARLHAVAFADPSVGRMLRLVWRVRGAHVPVMNDLASLMSEVLSALVDEASAASQPKEAASGRSPVGQG